MKKQFLLLISAMLALCSCGEKEDSSSTSNVDPLDSLDNNRTYYQLLVYSFADSNNDGIGDFKGIVDKLDYLVDLGVEGLWLSPILKCSSYHSYDVDDYYTINPSYEVTIDGTKYGYDYLLEKCHEKGIKVLMDLVINHCSKKNPLYKDHKDWFTSSSQWKFGFPEFDYNKAAPTLEAKKIGEYWLKEGFDGYRLDAAMWIFNSGSDRHTKNYAFWQDWCKAMRAVDENCYIIGEVLDENHDYAYDYAQAGFDSTFDFNTGKTVIGAVKDNDRTYATQTSANVKKATKHNKDYILARALSNHDIGRFNQEHPDSSDKAYYVEDIKQIKLANAVNALTPGNTFIYYGDELGLKGTCPEGYQDMNYRTPMPWENERTNSVKYFLNFKGNGVTTSECASNKSPEKDMKDANSIYTALKNALSVKNANETLQKGSIKVIDGLDSKLNGFDVTLGSETIRVVFNGSSNEVNYEMNGTLLYNLSATVESSNVTLPSYGLIVYTL